MVPIVVRDCKKANDYYELRISVTPDAGNSWIRLQQTMQNKLRVLDAEGHPLERRGGGSHAAGNEIDLTAAFARAQRPGGGLTGELATLLWEVPTETRDIHVPIEFTDLDMRILDN